jgi:hypothetical protein
MGVWQRTCHILVGDATSLICHIISCLSDGILHLLLADQKKRLKKEKENKYRQDGHKRTRPKSRELTVRDEKVWHASLIWYGQPHCCYRSFQIRMTTTPSQPGQQRLDAVTSHVRSLPGIFCWSSDNDYLFEVWLSREEALSHRASQPRTPHNGSMTCDAQHHPRIHDGFRPVQPIQKHKSDARSSAR